MDNQQSPSENRPQRREPRVEDLHLDRVVASQPEIGPTPPDGGYGWLIVVSAIKYNITVPAVLSLYGLVILKAIRLEGHDEKERMKIWDVDIALVPVILVVIRLLMEAWCRAMVKVFNMPRLMALAGLCLTIAGVLLSSYSTKVDGNEHIVSIFAGIIAGIGCALTGQQTDMIITHYFREKLTMVQRLVRIAPSVGNCLVPILAGYLLCNEHSDADVAVRIYGAILTQNCLFLASYTRPLYIEKVIRTTYNRLRDAVEDEDEVIFSNQNRPTERQEQITSQNPERQEQSTSQNPEAPSMTQEEDNDVIVYDSKKNAKEIIDPSMQFRENRLSSNGARFSSDFSTMTDVPTPSLNSNRFSSDFGTLEISSYSRINRYQELENIDRDFQNPQPLYRETTVDAPQSNLVFAAEVTPGTTRRTASLRKNFITLMNMLVDINFYLYALLHLNTTFSVLILGLVFPPMLWEQNNSMTVWSVGLLTALGHAAALCFIMLCLMLPKTLNEKTRLCFIFCVTGAIGFYGITLSSNKSFLVMWCMFASFSTAAASILQQPFFNSTLNDFDTTATMTTSNALVAVFIMAWSIAYNYEYKTCFLTASILQTVTACVFLTASFRRRR